MKKITISNVNAIQLFQLIRYGTLLLIGILLSKSELDKTDIGHYETFLLIAGAFTFFWVNGFLKVMLPSASEKSFEQKGIFIFNAFLLLLAFSLIAGLLLLSLKQPVSSWLLNGNQVPLPGLLAAYIVLNSPSMMTEYIYLLHHQSKKIVVYAIVTFTLQLAAVGLPPFFGYGLNTILAGLLLVSFLRFIWLLLVLRKYARYQTDWPMLREYIVLGSPLVLSTLLSSSSRYIDGFIITSQFSPDDLAVFQYGARELPLSMLLANSLGMAMLPRLSQKNIESPLAEFRSEIDRLHWLLFPVSMVLILTSHWFYPLVFNQQFAASATIFNIYLMLIISRLLFPQTLLMAQKMNKVIVSASLFEIIINVSLSIVLARRIGIAGVAYATLVAYLFEKIYLVIACKKRLNISLNKYLPLQRYIIMSTMLILVFIFVELILF
ncbi:MAG: oligosaccharide flippase family protein [Prolixibacteraceae bacterium]|nr:oligosaccharide flippase family protein [Prolixibacteraceae bacterium]